MIPKSTTYQALIEHAYDLEPKGFEVKDNVLYFQGINCMELIHNYGSPLKLSYLPKIATQIQKAKDNFKKALHNHDYDGKYIYSYCTKSSHFSFVLDTVLSQGAQLEISSAYDIQIIRNIWKQGKIDTSLMIICNGYKSEKYVQDIVDLWNDGFSNIIIVIDNANELNMLDSMIQEGSINIGIRIATEEEPSFDLYTSRLGISSKEIIKLYTDYIQYNPKFHFVMMHFFMNSKIKDTAYYRSELSRLVDVYADMKQLCDSVKYLDIGGGFPIMYSLEMEYDYEYMTDQIVRTIQHICDANGVQTPHIVTEFGSYTVGESGAIMYKVIGTKQQNEKELWYFINNSFITTLPDTRGIGQKFIVLPINGRDRSYNQINMGGITCDSDDYYNKDGKGDSLILPSIKDGEDLYIGIFHTGAYQESIGGYGGIQHCLIPAPKHIIIEKEDNQIHISEFAPEQDAQQMLGILGYN